MNPCEIPTTCHNTFLKFLNRVKLFKLVGWEISTIKLIKLLILVLKMKYIQFQNMNFMLMKTSLTCYVVDHPQVIMKYSQPYGSSVLCCGPPQVIMKYSQPYGSSVLCCGPPQVIMKFIQPMVL